MYKVLLLILTWLVTGCNEAADKNKMKPFDWLAGSWQMQDSNGITKEEWQRDTDSTMQGRSDFIKGDSVIPLEKISLAFKNDKYFYVPVTASQNNQQPVEFLINSLTDSSFTAENPQHDFPKRIVYCRINKDSLHAYIDGGPWQPGRRSDFYYSLIK